MPSRFSTIEAAVAAIRRGEVVIVVDAEDRENEGDFVCAASKVDMGHIVGNAVVPGINKYRPTGKGLQRKGRNKACGRLGHHHVYRSVLFGQATHKFGRFVASNAAGQAQNKSFASKIEHKFH